MNLPEQGRAGWRRDLAFYGVIPFMATWQGFKWELTRDAILGSVLAGLIGMKAKMSNGKPSDGGELPTEVIVKNKVNNPVPTTQEKK